MPLQLRRVLIVEDEFCVAQDIAEYIRSMNGFVLGPVPSVGEAENLVESADSAILDVRICGGTVFPIAEKLLQRGVPFVFFSAYEEAQIPSRFRDVARLTKPLEMQSLRSSPAERTGTFFENLESEGVVALLPHLRLLARLYAHGDSAADRLLERALERAIREARGRPQVALAQWLATLLAREVSVTRTFFH